MLEVTIYRRLNRNGVRTASMPSRIKRKIVEVGNSRAVTLPPDWLKKHPECNNVHLVYDSVILVFTDEQADHVDRIFEELIQRTLSEKLNDAK